MKPKIVLILGPTASGKSDLAVKLAREFNGEVISADSRQVYRGLDVGTGKITRHEMRGIPHHLLDVASPRRAFTVAQYQRLGARAIKDILRRGKLPIICGGTGFYIDSLLYDYRFPEAKPDPKLRKQLEKKSASELFRMLHRLDPIRAKNIDPHNPRRLMRAIEIVKTTGKPVPVLRKDSPYDILKIGITLPEAELKKRIGARLAGWLKHGLLPEIGKLHKSGVSWKRFEEFGLEYRYAGLYLQKAISKEEMVRESDKELWKYAKRQMTWFKRDPEIEWISRPAHASAFIRSFIEK